jgi:Cu2+-containing amine oxidase
MEANWLHPMPLEIKINTTAVNSLEWSFLEIRFCGQGPYESGKALADAYSSGKVRRCPFVRSTGVWDVPQQETKPSASGLHPKEVHGGVEWGSWSFTVTQRPSTGIALLDVRFHGERILYELAMQDAQAAYSGDRSTQFFYSDASWTLSMLSANLEPGVDCPEGAHFLSAPNWYQMELGGTATADPTNPRESFWPICIFEWDEDHTIWRHMQGSVPPEVRGLTRKTVVVRSICTVGNYDYITDVKLREDGEIEVHTRFAGYIESRYYNRAFNPMEANFSSILKPDLAGPVHSHTVGWKADLDIGGSLSNTFGVTKVKAGSVDGGMNVEGQRQEPIVSKYLEHRYVEKEGVGVSTFVADPRSPGQWAVVDRAARSAAGTPRGYAITLGTFATVNVLPDSHPFVRAMPFTKYHLALTNYHDDEYRATSPYIQYDGEATTKNAQDLDRFLSDSESLLDQDLVAWVSVGREHIVRQEDLPLVSNFGAAFSLQPWNFFEQNVAASPPW